MKKVEYFRNKKFLIVHGTADGWYCLTISKSLH